MSKQPQLMKQLYLFNLIALLLFGAYPLSAQNDSKKKIGGIYSLHIRMADELTTEYKSTPEYYYITTEIRKNHEKVY